MIGASLSIFAAPALAEPEEPQETPTLQLFAFDDLGLPIGGNRAFTAWTGDKNPTEPINAWYQSTQNRSERGIAITGDVRYLNIVASEANTYIPAIWIFSQGSPYQWDDRPLVVCVTSTWNAPVIPSLNPPTKWGGTMNGLRFSDNMRNEFYGGINGSAGSSGITVGKLWRLDCDEIGRVTAATTPTEGCIVVGGEMKVWSKLEVQQGNIQLVSVTDDILGRPGTVAAGATIQCLNGSIDEIKIDSLYSGTTIVPSGSLGSFTAGSVLGTSSSSPARVFARDGINTVQARSITYADINARSNSGTGNLGLLRVDGVNGTGDVVASNIGARSLSAFNGGTTFGIRTSGKVSSLANFVGNATQPMVINGGIEPGATINISGSLLPNADLDDSIVLPANGLKGQVIINSRNGLPANAPAGVWTGAVVVNGTPLTNPPYYDNLSAALGGGAIGLAPFHLHTKDSNAVNSPTGVGTDKPRIKQSYFNRSWADGTADDNFDLILSFYGPVRNESSALPGIIVEMLTPGGGSIDVTPYCTVTIGPPVAGGSNRWIKIHGCPAHRFMHGQYRVRPETVGTGRLLCADVNGDVPVEPFEYLFELLLDGNNNGVADADEIAANPALDADNDGYLDSTSQPSLCLADFNNDGFLDFTDFDDFVAAFEAGSPLADINVDGFLDFSDFDEFVAYFENDCADPTTPC